ncbi:MAG: FKBP-type peptidyl-prolyl cis-trans isomerase [Cyanobacteriota bacterium]
MAQAKVGDTVTVHYTGKLEDGTVFDSSVGRSPLEFSVGSGQVIPGFEEAVIGMSPGESKTQPIPCDQAYGPHRPEMVLVVDRQRMPNDLEVAEGQQLQLQHPSGQVIPVTITQIQDSQVTLDANHPLAGKDLTFEIELVNVAS